MNNQLERETKNKLLAFSNNLIQGHIKSNDFGMTNHFKVSFTDTMTSKERELNIPKTRKLSQIQFDKLHLSTVKQILEFSDDMIVKKEKQKEFHLDNGFKITFKDRKRVEREN